MPNPQALLRPMLEDLEQAEPLYKPTNFWESGLPAIAAELERHGFLIGVFDEFDLVARDAEVFGDVSWDGEFASEVLCLERPEAG